MKPSLFALAAGLTLAVAAPTIAAQYTFNFNGPGLIGSGIFTTADTATVVGGENAFQIIGISGMVNGGAIDSLLAPGSFLSNNNLLFPTAPSFFDIGGVGFTYPGATNANLYYVSASSSYRLTSTPFSSKTLTSLSLSPLASAPEPGTWLMMLAGFGMMGATLRGRRRMLRSTYAHAG